ncbi:MAG TPA: hypothetical protein VFZ58_03040 [Candidatus Saccharimonadales bacterium]
MSILKLKYKGVRFAGMAMVMVLLSIISLAFFSKQVDAQPITDFNPGRIIDDGVFADYGTMSVSNIQFFLNSKGVYCVDGQAPCLKNFNEGGRSAAQIIYDTAQEFKINPQVLIVVLQKEVGLVTANQPANWRYRTAMGYGCPDSTPGVCDSSYYGFTNQIRWAARMYRAIMNASPTWYTPYVVGNNFIQWHPNGGCGGTNVYIQNRATQALYNYTPYQPNQAALNAEYGLGDGCSSYGNRNFFLYFRDWFGNSRQSPIVRTPSSPTYWLLTNNKKYAIASGDILYAYGLESAPLSVVSDAYLSSIADGGMLNTIFTVPGDNTVFLADGGKKYGIASGEYCTRWGLQCGNPNTEKVIGPEISGLLGNGGILQPIMRFSGGYYLMENGKKKHFLNPGALIERGYSLAGSTPIVNWTNAIRPFDVSLPQNKTFVKFASNSGIYLYSDNAFFAIPDYETFVSWLGPQGLSYLDSSSSYNNNPPSVSGLLKTLVSNNGAISLVGRDNQFHLSNTQLSGTPFNITSYTQVKEMVAAKQDITVDETKALAVPSGTIMALKSSTLRPIPTMTDLRLSYADSEIMKLPSTLSQAYPTGKLYMIPGRVFKPTDSSAMYVYGADNNLWALGSLNELYSVLRWRDTVIQAPFGQIDFADIKVFYNLVKVNNIAHVVLPDGSLRKIPAGVIANQSAIMPLDGNMTKVIMSSTSDISFIRFDNGTIFKVNTNEMNPIGSLATYNNLGGNASNTAPLPIKALGTFRIGNSL